MAMMCPIDGCKKEKGLCIHEKMMLGMVAVLIVGSLGDESSITINFIGPSLLLWL